MNYQLIHDSIINKAKNRILSSYKEKHHIIPKSLGGKDNKENLVNLTAKEHYIIHRLLIEIYPNERKLVYAFWRMINDRKEQRYKACPRVYQQMRILAAKDLRDRFNNAPPESEIKRREGISKNNKKPKSDEHALKIRNAKKGDKNPMFGVSGEKHHRAKPVFQYSIKKEFIKKWGSRLLAEKEMGFTKGILYHRFNRGESIHQGFIWTKEEIINAPL